MAESRARSPRLGRGLSALLSQNVQVQPPAEAENDVQEVENSPETVETAENTPEIKPTGDAVVYLPIKQIVPNPDQPRKHFDDEALAGLAQSIKTDGIMQPVIVRPGVDDTYQIVAGERRWRASQLAELQTVPAIIRELTDQQTAEWSLIENLQREDLNPIERAKAFDNLIKQFELSHAQVAERVGIQRSTISNYLRLLDLPAEVQQLVLDGKLSNGQAKTIAGLSDPNQQLDLAKKAIAQSLSVRALEKLVAEMNEKTEKGDTVTYDPDQITSLGKRAHILDLQQQISQQLGTKVIIKPGRKKGSGSLALDFYSLDQFDTFLQKLGVDLAD
ncbi:MAG: ParB/RepB/Spo0J family partition protein [Phycisphaeraceae bacterium JB051]